jgi:hypothetical protein
MKSEVTKEAVSSALSTPAQQPNPKTKTGKAAGTRHNGKSKSKLKRRTSRAVTEENEKLRQKPRAGETRTQESARRRRRRPGPLGQGRRVGMTTAMEVTREGGPEVGESLFDLLTASPRELL